MCDRDVSDSISSACEAMRNRSDEGLAEVLSKVADRMRQPGSGFYEDYDLHEAVMEAARRLRENGRHA